MPRAMGCCPQGVANVLSMTDVTLCRFAISAQAAMSTSSERWIGGTFDVEHRCIRLDGLFNFIDISCVDKCGLDSHTSERVVQQVM